MSLYSLKKKKDFLEVKKQGKRYVGSFLTAEVYKGEKGSFFGITASKKYGNACTRNRFKRQVREALRALSSEISQNFTVVVYPKKEAKLERMPSLKKDLQKILSSFLEV